MPKLIHFLLVCDHDEGRLVDVRQFNDPDEAGAAYSATEREYEQRQAIEIVLIGSESWETVQLTHANYFDGSVAGSKYLTGI